LQIQKKTSADKDEIAKNKLFINYTGILSRVFHQQDTTKRWHKKQIIPFVGYKIESAPYEHMTKDVA